MADKLACRSSDEWRELFENPDKFRKRFHDESESESETPDIENAEKNTEIEEKYSEVVNDRKLA
jgi:hypothetical protein